MEVLAAVIGACAFVGVGSGQSPTSVARPETVGLDAAVLHSATELLSQFVEQRRIAGAVAGVARKGQVGYLVAVGKQDLDSGAPMTERSLFRIYSMTKPVTSVAIMMLEEEKRLSVGDPVSKYLPEFATVQVRTAEGGVRPPSRPITIEDLLLHTSGLNHRTSEIYRTAKVRDRSMTLPQLVTNLVRVPLMEDPATRYRYSEGTSVAGRIVEVVSGKPFDAFLEERVFRPLKMTDTVFWVDANRRSRLATVYGPGQGNVLTPIEIEALPFTERPALLEGAVGLVSTVPDYLRFAQMLLNRGELDGARLLAPATVDRMVVNGLADNVLAVRGGGMGWGLGNVNVVLDPARVNYPTTTGEYGWDGSAGTIFWNNPVKGTVTVLMTQTSPPFPSNLRQRFKTLIEKAIVN
jgi:CubicO group peptidase (beta-lactamase class C family)